MDYDDSTARVRRTAKKRLITEAEHEGTMGTATPLLMEGPSAPQPPNFVEQPDGKKCRAEAESPSLQLLLEFGTAYEPLPEDVPTPKVTRASEEAQKEAQEDTAWEQTTVGVTALLHCSAHKMYKCITPGCSFQSKSALSVCTHYGKYCQGKAQRQVKQEQETLEVEDSDGSNEETRIA